MATQVKIAGVDLTASVIFGTARFMSAVNGVPGEASLRVRDLTSSLSITPGATLELLVDGNPVWTGWCMQVKRVFAFPSVNVAATTPVRFFDIVGADINLLFQRRIVANYGAGTEENVYAPLYAAHTADTTVITELFANWLDLSGDGLDTTTDVHNVGDINEDQQARPWEGSDTWAQAMQSIASLPAAIYYIRPNKNFAYVDTDTPDAPFGLSDQPNGTTYKGYREMDLLFDGTNLANDVMGWGAGYGSNTPVFDRDTDATSLTAHGRWQLGQTTIGVYKQATIERIVDSIINGSPDHHRGQKDDRQAVMLVTYEKGLLPAQKVNFQSEVFGFTTVFPIRKMEVTFETPDNPRFAFTLSNEIDAPWSFFDPYRLNLPPLPGVSRPTWTPPNLNTGGCPPLCEQPTYRVATDDYSLTYPYVAGSLSVKLSGTPVTVTETDPDTGVFSYSTGDQSADLVACYTVIFQFDSFNRTVAGGWGTSTDGHVWTEYSFTNHDLSVDGTNGYGVNRTGNHGGSTTIDNVRATATTGSLWAANGYEMNIRFKLTGHMPFSLIELDFVEATNFSMFITVLIGTDPGQTWGWTTSGDTDSATQVVAWSIDSWYRIRHIAIPGVSVQTKLWKEADGEPSTFVTVANTSNPFVAQSCNFEVRTLNNDGPNVGHAFTDVLYDWMNFDYAGKPCYVDCSGGGSLTLYDDFSNRTIIRDPDNPDWGQPSSGGSNWNANGPGPDYVNGGEGKMEVGPQDISGTWSASTTQQVPIPAPLNGSVTKVVKHRFKTSRVPINGDGALDEHVGWSNDFQGYLVHFGFSIGSETDNRGPYIVTDQGNEFGADIDWLPDTWYWVLAFQNATEAKMKFWIDGDPEPSTWLLTHAVSYLFTLDSSIIFRISRDSASPSITTTFSFDDIYFGNGEDCPDVPSVPGGPLFGPWRENAVRIDSTHYQLSRAISPGTSYVWLDGFIVRLTTDYTEDAAAGIIVFGAAVGSTVTVTVGYNADGMPS